MTFILREESYESWAVVLTLNALVCKISYQAFFDATWSIDKIYTLKVFWHKNTIMSLSLQHLIRFWLKQKKSLFKWKETFLVKSLLLNGVIKMSINDFKDFQSHYNISTGTRKCSKIRYFQRSLFYFYLKVDKFFKFCQVCLWVFLM